MTKFVICYWSKHCMLRPSLWFVTGQNVVCYDQVYNSFLVRTLCYDQVYDLLLVRTLHGMTKFMICYRSKHCMLRPSLWFVTGQNTMLRPSLWFVTRRNIAGYNQVYDLVLVRTLIVTTKFMICYWSERCMLRPSLWFVTSDNAVIYNVTTKFIICYWSEHCMLRPSLWFVTGQNTMVWSSLWFVTGQNAVSYDQVCDLLLVNTLYVTTKFMICCWSERCILRPSL